VLAADCVGCADVERKDGNCEIWPQRVGFLGERKAFKIYPAKAPSRKEKIRENEIGGFYFVFGRSNSDSDELVQ